MAQIYRQEFLPRMEKLLDVWASVQESRVVPPMIALVKRQKSLSLYLNLCDIHRNSGLSGLKLEKCTAWVLGQS